MGRTKRARKQGAQNKDEKREGGSAIVSEKKREKKARKEPSREERAPKLEKDWSAEERFVNRSLKIRKRIYSWLLQNRGRLFETSSVMSDMCANDCKCSSITAYRWLHQYTAPNTTLQIAEQEAGLVIQDRKENLALE